MSGSRTSPSPKPKSAPPSRGWLAAALLAAGTFAAFSPALKLGFVNFDDDVYVFRNPAVTAGLSLEWVVHAFTTFDAANWHPLTWLSLQLDASLFGPSARGFHLTNVLLHAANAALAFLALRSLTGAFWRSVVVAALFAVHPLRVESVAWISERKDVLSIFFGLLALWAYAGYARDQSPRRYVLVAVPFVLSLLAKPTLVTLPFLLLVLDWWPLERIRRTKRENKGLTASSPLAPVLRGEGSGVRGQGTANVPLTPDPSPPKRGRREQTPSPLAPVLRGEGGKRDYPVDQADREKVALDAEAAPAVADQSWRLLIAEKLPLLALCAASAVVTVWAQSVGEAVRDLEKYPPGARLANATVSYVEYAAKTAWPVGLAPFYPYPKELPAWEVAGAALLLTALTGAAVVLRRRAPYLLTGWLWYLGTLVPVIGLVQVGLQAYADRYTYFPQLGLLLAVTWGVADLARGRAREVLAAAAAAVVALAILTRGQIAIWSDSLTLWKHDIRAEGPNFLALSALGYAYQLDGHLTRAVDCYRQAAALDPTSTTLLLNFGNALRELGLLDEAALQFEQVRRLRPKNPAGYNNLGIIRSEQGRLDEAERLFEEARSLGPEQSESYFNLGLLAEKRKDFARAEANFRQALELRPDFPQARAALGNVLLRPGSVEEGLAELREAVLRNPDYAQGHTLLAKALAGRGDLEGAADHFERAAELRPGLAVGWYNLGVARGRQGRMFQAAEALARAVRLDPNSAQYRKALAGALDALRSSGRSDLARQIEEGLPRATPPPTAAGR